MYSLLIRTLNLSYFYASCSQMYWKENLECMFGWCSWICTGNGSQCLHLSALWSPWACGFSEKGLWVPKMPGLRERCLEDRRYYCFLSLPPRSSTGSWVKCSSTCAPVLWDKCTCREYDSMYILQDHWKKILCCYMKIYWKFLYFTGRTCLLKQKEENLHHL